MAKRKPKRGQQSPAKRIKTQPSGLQHNSGLLDVPLEILDIIVQMILNDPGNWKQKRKFFQSAILPPQWGEGVSDEYFIEEVRSLGVCEDDRFMHEVLRRPIFRTCTLIRQRARQYVFYKHAWIRLAFKTQALQNRFDETVNIFPVCKFTREHLLPDDLPTFDVFVGSANSRAAANSTFATSQRIEVLPFEFKTWLAICAALQKIIWSSDPGPTFRRLSVRCDQDSCPLLKLLPTYILPPFLAIRSLFGITFAGQHLKSLPRVNELRMIHNKGGSDPTYLEDMTMLLSHSRILQSKGDTEGYNYFVLHTNLRANHIADKWFGAEFIDDGFRTWRRVDPDAMKLRSLLCTHIVQASRVWHDLCRSKGVEWLHTMAKWFEVSGEHRWCYVDFRVAFGPSREERGEMHLAAGLATEISAKGILAMAPDYIGMGPEAAEEDAWRTMGESISHLWKSVNLNPLLAEEARQWREDIQSQRAQIGNFDEEDEVDLYDPEPNTYVEFHRVAGGKFCWTGDEYTMQEFGGVNHLLLLKELYQAEVESETSLRCGRACNCVMI